MRQPRTMFVLVLIASAVLCAETRATLPNGHRPAVESSSEPIRVVRKVAEELQRRTKTVVTPRLVRVLRAPLRILEPVTVHIPHRPTQPFRFRLPPPGV